MTIRVGIIGATGHTGEELLYLLLKHPGVRIASLANTSDKKQVISEVFPALKNKLNLVVHKPDFQEISRECDVVFLALPHTVSMKYAGTVLALGKRVIDLSADYRLKNKALYRKCYAVQHSDTKNLKTAVYGLPELYRTAIQKARLIANPGCYPTAALLAVAPLIAGTMVELSGIVIDAKSGVTGAGKKLEKGFLFSEINEDFRAYKVGVHQHSPEINSILSLLAHKPVSATFVPHLLPLNRGILTTVYMQISKKRKHSAAQIIALYKRFYKNEPFVRIREAGSSPRIKDVVGTNFCDIGIHQTPERLIIIAVIDNLIKGASGQAVQNLNIMFNVPETTGLL